MNYSIIYLNRKKGAPRKTYRQSEAGQESYCSKEWVVSGKVSFLLGKAGVYQADYPTSAYQVIANWLVEGHDIPGRGWSYS